MDAISSGTMLRATTRNLRRSKVSATAGPERSVFSPREHESLTVRTAAVVRSGVEEDIFSLGRVPVGFVQLAQSFHQQTLGVQRCCFLGGLSVEVNLEVAVGPAQNFEDRLVAGDGAIRGVFDLALMEVHLALVIAVGHGE